MIGSEKKESILSKTDYYAILRIVLVYSAFGSLWIYLSDSILGLFVKDPLVITKIAMFKGILFILTTAVLLYVLIARRVKKIIGSEKRLHRSEERFKQIAENAEEIIWEVNRDALFTYINPVFETILGQNPEEFINKKYIYDLVDLETKEKVKKEILGEFNNRAILKRFVITCLNKDGKEIILETNASPVLNSDGFLIGYRGANIDITERKKTESALRESEEKYRALIEASPDAILMLSLKGRIILANEKAADMHSYPANKDLIGMHMTNLISPTEMEHFQDNLEKAIESGRPVYDEYVFVKNNGKKFFADLNMSVVYNSENKPKAVTGVVRDITERKKILEELILAKNKAEEANKTKDLFLANMSHELRTPLIGILGYSDLLTETIKEEESIEMAKGIKRSGKRLLNTLNMILNFTKIESEKYEVVLRPYNIKEELESVYKMFKGAAREKGLEFGIEIENPDLVINTDPSFLAVIMENLVNNAIKFTTEGSIKIKAGIEDSGHVYIKVKDTGIGIEEQHFGTIFQEFRQVSEGINREFQGTGLGLSIAKKYTEMMNGTIDVESVYGEGAMFTLLFPMKEKH